MTFSLQNDSVGELKKIVTEILCAVIRGENVTWQPAAEKKFYDVFLDIARHHGVDALVCHFFMGSSGWEALPYRIQNVLMQAVRNQAIVEMVRTADLIALLASLREAGISILLLKGAALSYTHYSDPYLRSRCDTDILIRFKDIRKIQDVFCDLGYQCRGTIYKSHQFSCSRKAPPGVEVAYDVHWRLSNNPEFSRVVSYDDGVLDSVLIQKINCPVLSPEHALMQACMHRAGNPDHDQDRLTWLYDIHLLLSGMSEAVMVQFAQRAVEKNIQQICLEAVCRAQECFITKVPEQVFDILSLPLKIPSARQKFAESYLGLIMDDLYCLPETKMRFSLLRELLFPPSDELLRKYGKEDLSLLQKRLCLPVLHGRYLTQGLLRRIFRLR